MCNTRAITYTCNHTLSFRLSTCRGIFTYQGKRGREFLCASYAQLNVYSTMWKCGSCEREEAEKKIDAWIEEIRKGVAPAITAAEEDSWAIEDGPDELVEAEAERARKLYCISRMFPPGEQFKKMDRQRPEKGESVIPSSAMRRGSLLRREVRAEEVVSVWEPTGDGWDWGQGYASLADELAEDEQERLADGLPQVCPPDAWESNGLNEQQSGGDDPTTVADLAGDDKLENVAPILSIDGTTTARSTLATCFLERTQPTKEHFQQDQDPPLDDREAVQTRCFEQLHITPEVAVSS